VILKVFLAIGVVLAVLMGMVLWLGGRLPERHRIAVAMRLRQSPDAVFDTIADVKAAASWRDGMTSSVLLDSAADGALRFRQTDGNGTITYRIEESERPKRFVTRIDDQSLPFGGTWTISITANGEATDVEVVEEGEVRSSLFRFFARYVFGYHRSAEAYLRGLGKRFGEDAPIRRIAS
jgi:uncharacterized protein YndB with AHSA1/START domain